MCLFFFQHINIKVNIVALYVPFRFCSFFLGSSTCDARSLILNNFHLPFQNFGARNDTIFCGVFDGHGPNGHMVAKRVRDVLPLKLTSNWEGGEYATSEASCTVSLKQDSKASTVVEEKEGHSQIFKTLKDSFLKAFKIMDKELKQHPEIDCFYSGTTAVTLVKQVKDYPFTTSFNLYSSSNEVGVTII